MRPFENLSTEASLGAEVTAALRDELARRGASAGPGAPAEIVGQVRAGAPGPSSPDGATWRIGVEVKARLVVKGTTVSERTVRREADYLAGVALGRPRDGRAPRARAPPGGGRRGARAPPRVRALRGARSGRLARAGGGRDYFAAAAFAAAFASREILARRGVLVDDALRRRLLERAGRGLERVAGGVRVALGDRLAGLLHGALHAGADLNVAGAALLRLTVALLGRCGVRQADLLSSRGFEGALSTVHRERRQGVMAARPRELG